MYSLFNNNSEIDEISNKNTEIKEYNIFVNLSLKIHKKD